MDCPKCGKSFGFLGNQFWCRKCKAYFCDSCAREKLVCPKCGGRISVDKSSILPISLMMVAIIILVMSLVVSSFSYSYEYTKIADLRPGEHVRIYGVINSSTPVVARVAWSNNSWQLQNYTPFELSDPGNSSLSVPINLSQCKYFNLDEEPSSGCNTYEYRTGQPVTVKGWVTIGQAGNLSVNSTSIYPGKLPSGTGFPSYFVLIGGGLTLLSVAVAGFQMYRRSQHCRYPEQNPVLKMPEQLPAEKPPETRNDWVENPLSRITLRWSRPLKYVAAFAGVPMFIGGLIFFFLGYMPAVVLMTPALLLIIFSAMQSIIDSNTPTMVAIAEDGLHMQYARPRGQGGARTFIDWNDIKYIYLRTEEKVEGIQIELKDGMTLFRASTELLDAVQDAYRQYRANHNENSPARTNDKLTPAIQPVSDNEPAISTHPTGTIRNRLPGWMTLIGISMISAGFLAVGAYTYFNWNDTDLDFWENLGIIALVFFASGLMLIGIGYNALDEVIFSKIGIAFRYRGSTNTPQPVQWGTISRVSPIGMGWFSIEQNFGETTKLMLTEQRIAERIVQEIDRRYLENHPESRAGVPTEPVTDRIDNAVKKRTGRFLIAMICVFSVGIVILGISMYPVYFVEEYKPMTSLAGIYLSMPFIAFPVVLFSKKYPLWRFAPYTVRISRTGIVTDHRARVPPAGHAGPIGWDEISGIETLAEAVKALQLTWDLRDTEKSKTIVIRKKSGTAHILGPVDPVIVDAVKRRIPKSS